jgi:peptide-methionine (S)-S-oxide reductase
VGYTGGTTDAPTYRQMGDHTESLQLDYDPAQISYEAILDIFWASHNSLAKSFSTQYKVALFVHNETQKKLAQQSVEKLEGMHPMFKGRIMTEILPAKTFYLAEDYHQKYKLQHNDVLLAELLRYYPSIAALTRSTAATRLNGILGGYGEVPQTTEQLSALGIQSPAAIRSLPQRRKRA